MTEFDRDDAATAGAVGLVAYVVADLTHHLFGHAAACVVLGGRIQSLTAIHVGCTVTGAAVDLAGPAANLIVGVGAWLLAAFAPAPRIRLFLILCAAFNLLWLEGQLIFSAAAHQDDWDQLIRALTPQDAWRWGLFAFGVSAYVITVRALGMALHSFAFPQPARLRRLMALAYVAGGFTAVATGLRDPGGVHALVHQAGPQALILPVGILFVRVQGEPMPPAADQLKFSAGWTILAVMLLVGSVTWLGPGLV
jgi:hypothetical protein